MLTADVVPEQYEFITAKEKYLFFIAGRRFGKTHAMKLRMIKRALEQPGYFAMYLTSDGSLCNEIFRDLCSDKYLRKRIKRIEKQPSRQIFFRNGSRLYFRMIDKMEKVLGFGVDELYIDEVQKIGSLSDRDEFYRVMAPLILERKGRWIIGGQWASANCWYYKLWLDNQNNPEYRCWSIPSWLGYHFREFGEDHPEIQSLKRAMPKAIYKQSIACEPGYNENAAFDIDDIKACAVGEFKGPIAGHEYAIGVDLGRSVDHSAWCVIDLNTAEIVHVEKRRLGEKHGIAAVQLELLAKKYNSAEVFVDTTGGASGGKHDIDAFVKFYRETLTSMRAVMFQRRNKIAMVQNLTLAIQNHEITIPKDAEELLGELYDYECSTDRWGNVSYNAPKGLHDDLCIALVLAYEGYRVCSFGYNPTTADSVKKAQIN